MELTKQEKTIIKACIMVEVRDIEQLNYKLENKNDAISTENYNHNNDNVNYLKSICKKLEAL